MRAANFACGTYKTYALYLRSTGKALCVFLFFCLSWGLSWLCFPLAERRKIPTSSHILSYVGVRVLPVLFRGSRSLCYRLAVVFYCLILLAFSADIYPNDACPCQTLITRVYSGVLPVDDNKINPTTPPPIAQPQLQHDLGQTLPSSGCNCGRVFSRLLK